ncbi:uncharacterized protein LOC123849498 isoform X1 [Mirounga angustirostris]|uniref:uncharacterized protein LOC123849498 isoform X1 n=1 Tax=Mirounga angustirostris TaxID=9716 RepID=UPI001E68614C
MFYKNPPLFLGYALGSYVLQRPKESKKLRVLPTWRHGEVEAFPTRTGPVGAVTGERCVGSGRRDAHCELLLHHTDVSSSTKDHLKIRFNLNKYDNIAFGDSTDRT